MKILIALSNQSCGESLLSFMKSHTWLKGTTARIIHVVEDDAEDTLDDYAFRTAKLLEDIASEMQQTNPELKVEKALVFGSVAPSLVDHARAWHANLILMGYHKRKNGERMVLGKTAEQVIAASGCSVVVTSPTEPTQPADTPRSLSSMVCD